jgi:hypothetical protein
MIDKRKTVTATPVDPTDPYRGNTTAIMLELQAKNAALELRLAELQQAHTRARKPLISEKTKATLVLVWNMCWFLVNVLWLVMCFLVFLVALVPPGGHIPRSIVLFIASMGVVRAIKYLWDWASS